MSARVWLPIILELGILLSAIFAAYRKLRDDAEKRRLDAVRDVDRRHEETQEKLNLLLTEREYLPQHYHAERGREPLLASGIIRRPTRKYELE